MSFSLSAFDDVDPNQCNCLHGEAYFDEKGNCMCQDGSLPSVCPPGFSYSLDLNGMPGCFPDARDPAFFPPPPTTGGGGDGFPSYNNGGMPGGGVYEPWEPGEHPQHTPPSPPLCLEGMYWNDDLQDCSPVSVVPPGTGGIKPPPRTGGIDPIPLPVPWTGTRPDGLLETILGFPAIYVLGAAAVALFVISSMGGKK